MSTTTQPTFCIPPLTWEPDPEKKPRHFADTPWGLLAYDTLNDDGERAFWYWGDRPGVTATDSIKAAREGAEHAYKVRMLERELTTVQAELEQWKENAAAAKRQRDVIIDEGVEKQGRIDELEAALELSQKAFELLDRHIDQSLPAQVWDSKNTAQAAIAKLLGKNAEEEKTT